MHPLNFIIPYSYWPGPVNTIWGIEVGKYRLRVGDGRGKYKLDSGPGTRTKAGGQETHAPVKVSRHKSCSIYKLLPMYKHTKNCLITRVSPGLIFGVSWYRIFRKKNHLSKKCHISMYCLRKIIFHFPPEERNQIFWKRNTMIPHNTRSIILQWDFLQKENFLFFQHIWKKNCFRYSTWRVNEFMLVSSIEIWCVNFVTSIVLLETLKCFVEFQKIFIIESVQLY